MKLERQTYIILISFYFCLLNADFAKAQINQYQAYKVIVDGSIGEPSTTFQETDIILDLNRDRISIYY